MKFEAFEDWLHREGKYDTFTAFIESGVFAKLLEERNSKNSSECLEAMESFSIVWEEFDAKIRKGDFGPMARFWQSFIDMGQTMLDFIKAIRTGDWDLHLQSCEQMLVWMHAYDRINYSRHFTYYWVSQQNLQARFPAIYQEFKNGNFSTKRSPGKLTCFHQTR